VSSTPLGATSDPDADAHAVGGKAFRRAGLSPSGRSAPALARRGTTKARLRAEGSAEGSNAAPRLAAQGRGRDGRGARPASLHAATARTLERLHAQPLGRDRALTLSLLLAAAGVIASILLVLLSTGSG
jgi:hypothetical protein